MFADLYLFCLGAAVVVDTALLLSILERRNWRYVTPPVVAIITGVWLFHSGVFVNFLLIDPADGWSQAARWLARCVLSAGLMLMPSAMVHGATRFLQSGLEIRTRRDWRYGLAYLPLIVMPAAMRSLSLAPDRPYLELMSSYLLPYVVWICIVNLGSAFTFLFLRRKLVRKETRRFLASIALTLLLMSGWVVYALLFAADQWRDPTSPLPLSVLMTPLAPALLFAYFVIHYRFMQLMLERTFVYGTVLAAVLLFHQLVVEGLVERLDRRYRENFAIMEGVLLFLVILAYQPIRRRVAESLRYLLGHSLDEVRERTRKLSVDIWQHLDDSPQQMVDWFVASIRESFGVERAAVWLYDEKGDPFVASGTVEQFEPSAIRALRDVLPPHGYVAAGGLQPANFDAFDQLKQLQGGFAVRLDQENVSGLLLLGRRPSGGEPSEEETHAILLVVEQLGVALHNSHLQRLRLDAERRAAQNEKLSTLGLLTSCVAHEIKNPLSSIKTIATVLGEQMGPRHEHAKDVRMILDEVDRLSETTSQFLTFSRPEKNQSGPTELVPAIESAVHVLSHLARQRGVTVTVDLATGLPLVSASQNTVREILFNLMLNAIEAACEGGIVSVAAHGEAEHVVIAIQDDGPGIPDELQNRIFDPFVSDKPGGTGLGLYIVGRAVNEVGGKIDCQSNSIGTQFTVTLPIVVCGRGTQVE
jgi:signal transduction histidine kinase